MTEGLANIIAQLEHQKAAIERALAALREVEGSEVRAEPATRNIAPKKAADVGPVAAPEAPVKKRRKISAAARRKMALGQQARWAKIRGESEPASLATSEPAKPKRKISPEGMKRIIAATKKRWRLQKAAAKSAPARKVSPKKTGDRKPSQGSTGL